MDRAKFEKVAADLVAAQGALAMLRKVAGLAGGTDLPSFHVGDRFGRGARLAVCTAWLNLRLQTGRTEADSLPSPNCPLVNRSTTSICHPIAIRADGIWVLSYDCQCSRPTPQDFG